MALDDFNKVDERLDAILKGKKAVAIKSVKASPRRLGRDGKVRFAKKLAMAAAPCFSSSLFCSFFSSFSVEMVRKRCSFFGDHELLDRYIPAMMCS